MKRVTKAMTAGAALMALTASVAFPPSGMDYSKLPPKADELQATIAQLKVSAAQAIETVLKETKGVARSVTVQHTASPAVIDVTVLADGQQRIVSVDANTGQIVHDEQVAWLPGAAPTGQLMKSATGLMYYEQKLGEGEQPTNTSATVTLHYTGWLTDGTKFDSSVDGGKPITMVLSQFVKGWQEGVGGMRVGGKRKLLVPPDLGYGARGYPGAIPPNALLIFDVELLNVKNPTAPPQP